MIPPATVARPPVRTAWSSDWVRAARNGLIIKGASVWRNIAKIMLTKKSQTELMLYKVLA